MRFKPRTDLERIFEEITKNSSRNLSKQIVANQIRELNSRRSNNSNESILKFKEIEKEKNLNGNSAMANEKENNITNKYNLIAENYKPQKSTKQEESQLKLEKEEKLELKKRGLNSEAKYFMKEFHYKTHFKAVKTIANYYREKGKAYMNYKNIFSSYHKLTILK